MNTCPVCCCGCRREDVEGYSTLERRGSETGRGFFKESFFFTKVAWVVRYYATGTACNSCNWHTHRGKS